MSNNSGIYNAVITGGCGGFQNVRWITQGISYTDFRDSIVIIATLIDSKIPTQSLLIPELNLMQYICNSVFSSRYPPTLPDFNSIANAIVELWSSLRSSILPQPGDVPLGSADGQILYWNESENQEWEVTPGSPTDQQTFSWDSANVRYNFIDQPDLGNLQYFDTTHSPVGLWNFNDTLADVSGNGNDFTLTAGDLAFSTIVPDRRALYVCRNARYETASNPPVLQLTGDMTALAIIQRDREAQVTRTTVTRFSGIGDTEDNNILYWLGIELTAIGGPVVPRRMFYMHEDGAGNDDEFVSDGDASLPPVHNIEFIAFRRQSNVIRFYHNGRQFGGDSGTFPAPTGGDSSVCRLLIGGSTPLPSGSPAQNPFLIFSLKLIPSALTDAEVLAEYNRTMGPAFGELA